jgi:hypothetical protein
MDMGKVPFMTIRQLLPESNKSKDLRIRELEPLGSNLAIHCRADHKDFITEWSEYIPTNRLCKKDLLDAAAYQVQIAQPGIAESLPKRKIEGELMVLQTADDLLRSFWDANTTKDMFGNPKTPVNPYQDRELSVDTMLSGVIDPFNSGT